MKRSTNPRACLLRPSPPGRKPLFDAPVGAFTLVETMVTMAIFSFAVIGVVDLHIFGLKLNRMVDVKLESTEDARRALDHLVRDIHGAGVVLVGTGSATAFTSAAFNTPQSGNAVQICPVKTDTNTYVRYYLNTTNNQLERTDNGGGKPFVVSEWVTNSVIFSSEDCAGNVLSNSSNNRVIGIDLEFYRPDDPLRGSGSGNYYDSYRLQTRVTQRTLK
jgi:type II secretory pathway pseudopilin PulG